MRNLKYPPWEERPLECPHLSTQMCPCALCPGRGCAPCHYQEPGFGHCSTYWGRGCHIPNPSCHKTGEQDRILLRRLQIGSGAVGSGGGERWPGRCRQQKQCGGSRLPKAENHWREQRQHPATVPCIVLIQDPSQRHMGEIQGNLYKGRRLWQAVAIPD